MTTRKKTRKGLVRGFSKRYYKSEDVNGQNHSSEYPKTRNSRVRRIVDEYSDFHDLYTSYSDVRFNS